MTELKDKSLRRIDEISEILKDLGRLCANLVTREHEDLTETLKQRLPADMRSPLARRALELVEVQNALRGDRLEDTLDELSHLIHDADDELQRARHAELFWRVMAMRIGLGRLNVQAVGRAAFATIVGALPNYTGLEKELHEMVEELEAIENAAANPGNLRQLQLDGDPPLLIREPEPPPDPRLAHFSRDGEWDDADDEAFFRAYLATGLEDSQRSHDDRDEEDADEPHVDFTRELLADEALREMRADVLRFLDQARPLLIAGRPDDWPQQGGYDFWMTRNGHGVGFWETPDWPEGPGSGLTAICEAGFVAVSIYLGDDGRLYYGAG